MNIRAYLRASTKEQDATRAKAELAKFSSGYGFDAPHYYIENESGAKADRPQLMRLLDEAIEGDVILVESIDRLSRLAAADWEQLSSLIRSKRLRIVAQDLPTSWQALSARTEDEFTARMLDAINGMMVEMMAAIARKDYEQRRVRQSMGIEKAKTAGKYKGRQADPKLRQRVIEALSMGKSIRQTAEFVGCAPSSVQRIKREVLEADNDQTDWLKN